jgi:PDZ domain-containing protein/aspartyl protease
MNNKLFLLLLLLYSTSYAQKNASSFSEPRMLGFVLPEGEDKVSIPFEVYNNLIVLDIVLNHTLPLKFVLDTGIRTTVLTEKTLTDLLNVTYSRKITIPGAGGIKLVDAFVVNDVTINIGNIQGQGHALLVLETDLLKLKNYLGVNVHGVLGYELFSRFVVDINYDKKKLTLYNPTTFKKKKRFEEMSITIEDTKPYLEASLIIRGDKVIDGKFMLDTGASHTLMLDECSSDSVFVPEPNIATVLGRGLGGRIDGRVARVDKLWVNDFEFKDLITTFPDEESYDVALDPASRTGTFGGGMMSRFNLVFDYVHSKLYVRKGKGFRKPFEFNLSGITVITKGIYLREYEVDNVREGSSAEEAGVMVGDKIITINHVNTSKLDLNNVIGMLNGKPNRVIRLDILRDNKRKHIQFKLRRLI